MNRHLEYNFEHVRDLVIQEIKRLPLPRNIIRYAVERINMIRLVLCKDCDRDHERRWRQFCHTLHYEATICCARETANLDSENIRGLMFHEFGHLLAEEEIVPFPLDFGLDVIPSHSVLQFYVDGREVDAEVFADVVVERVLQVRIYYDKKKLQWVEE